MLIINTAYKKAEEILNEYMEKLHFIASFLFKNEIMDEIQFDAVMGGNPTIEYLESIMSEHRRRSEEENRVRAELDAAEKKKREEEESSDKKNRHGENGAGLDAYPQPEKKKDDEDKK
jgi:hypothetical protein